MFRFRFHDATIFELACNNTLNPESFKHLLCCHRHVSVKQLKDRRVVNRKNQNACCFVGVCCHQRVKVCNCDWRIVWASRKKGKMAEMPASFDHYHYILKHTGLFTFPAESSQLAEVKLTSKRIKINQVCVSDRQARSGCNKNVMCLCWAETITGIIQLSSLIHLHSLCMKKDSWQLVVSDLYSLHAKNERKTSAIYVRKYLNLTVA